MMPNLGLHDYALRSSWPHILSQVQSVLHYHRIAGHQSVFCSHQWGFSCKFTIKTLLVYMYSLLCFSLYRDQITNVAKQYEMAAGFEIESLLQFAETQSNDLPVLPRETCITSRKEGHLWAELKGVKSSGQVERQFLSCTAPMWTSSRMNAKLSNVSETTFCKRHSPKYNKNTLLTRISYIFNTYTIVWIFQLRPVDPKPPAPRSVSSSVWKSTSIFI